MNAAIELYVAGRGLSSDSLFGCRRKTDHKPDFTHAPAIAVELYSHSTAGSLCLYASNKALCTRVANYMLHVHEAVLLLALLDF